MFRHCATRWHTNTQVVEVVVIEVEGRGYFTKRELWRWIPPFYFYLFIFFFFVGGYFL